MFNKDLLKYVAVFVLFFAIFFGWHAMHVGLLGTDDPYYHSKHSYLMTQSGNFTLVGNWVPFHFLTSAPVDLWWLYHVIAAVFIKFCGIIWGAKIWSAVCAALVFTAFYFILKQLKIFYPFVWTFLLFVSSATFTIRLLFERPFVLSIAFLTLCFYFTLQKKYWPLIITLILYVLTYQLAPVAFLILAVFLAVDWYFERRFNVKLLAVFLAAAILGVILHPESLNYIYVMYVTFVKIYYLKFSGVDLNIGSELQAHGFGDFLHYNIIVLAFYIIAVALFGKLFSDKKSSRLQLALFFISLVWFLIALVIPRGTEYFLPFGYLFIAVMFDTTARSADWQIARQFINQKVKTGLVLIFIYGVIAVFAGYNLFSVFGTLRERNQNDKDIYYQEAGEWLINNTPQDSVVFYPIWSMFPQLFFYDSYNRYLTAYDPTFLYEYNHDIYYTWANIAYRGVYCPREWPCLELSPRQELRGVKYALKNILGAETIIIPNKPDAWLYKVFANLKDDFEKSYENRELVIFKIKL
ncbi:MAG: hypothetical protein WCV41_01475 [Patescibacteria group bacterium]